jgi:GntR family transcriptional regulator, transcriptional repressor for pyruvate dehydrogenase complex
LNPDHESGKGVAGWRSDNSLARSPKISELVARELAKRIIDGHLVEGTQLPNERELIEIFGVGRTTLREALRLLETRGVITIRTGPRGGPIVRRPRAQDLSDALTLILQFEGAALSDVLEARAATEPAIARLAAQQITDSQLEELEASIERMAASTEQMDAFLAENAHFHGLIGEAAGSVALRVFLRSLESIVRTMLVNVDYATRQRKIFVAGHRGIVDALRARDPVAAERAMREHLTESGRFWTRNYSHLTDVSVHWA